MRLGETQQDSSRLLKTRIQELLGEGLCTQGCEKSPHRSTFTDDAPVLVLLNFTRE